MPFPRPPVQPKPITLNQKLNPLRTRTRISAHGELPESRRGEPAQGRHQEHERQLAGRTQLLDEHAHGDVHDEHHGQDEGEEGLEQAFERLVRLARNVEEVVVTPDDALRTHRPEAHARQQEHERVMDEQAHNAQ